GPPVPVPAAARGGPGGGRPLALAGALDVTLGATPAPRRQAVAPVGVAQRGRRRGPASAGGRRARPLALRAPPCGEHVVVLPGGGRRALPGAGVGMLATTAFGLATSRGLDLAIDAPSGVLAAPAASEDECKRKCTDMGLDDCTGIEYHHGADNRCLLWSQPVKGIVVRKGASCLVRAPSGSFTVEADTACGAPDAVHAEVGISPESCQSLCLTTLRARCVAVEHDSKTGGCKIFDEPTGGGHAALGVTCSRFELGAPGESSSSTTVTTSLTLTTSHRIAANNSRNGATEDTTVTSATTATTATTTSTAIEVCQQPTEGGSCYSNVLSTMRVAKQMSPDARPKGLLGKGGACAGLLTSTSFETFQACLHTAPDFGCDAPCPCHTAQPGERCYQTVVWVMNQGIAQRPDWYPGLGPGSSFEEIQDFLYRDGTGNSSCDER
ncbi:unnamed protein product, partial [Prorocentrum cordatum]